MKTIFSLSPSNLMLGTFSFSEMIDSLCQLETAKKNVLGDSLMQVCYFELPSYIAAIESALQISGISPNECLAFECQNTTPALLTLLALFYRGQHILLLPPEDNPMKEPGFRPNIPSFCQNHLTVNALTREEKIQPEKIASLLNHYSNNNHEKIALDMFKVKESLLLLRTSGSMGDAKIVCFTHADLIGNSERCIQRFELENSSRVTIAVPIFHMYGLGAGLIPSLLVGACIDIQANTNILRFLAHERRFSPDTIYLNPTLCAMLLKGRRNDKLFKRTISAGAPLPLDTAKEYQRRFGSISNLYGSTEMGVIATESPYSSDSNTSFFIPLPGVEMKISNENNNALYCLHPNGFNGYINNEGHTLPCNIYLFNTGDRADSKGSHNFRLIGRQGNSTNRSGFLVQFDDIENALLKTGIVEQTIVVESNEETMRGKKIYAFCTTKNAYSLEESTAETIRKSCQLLLPKYAVPDHVILIKQFPLSVSGKIDRQALIQQVSQKKERARND